MAALDWIFLAVLAASMLLGAWRGLVYEVMSVIGLGGGVRRWPNGCARGGGHAADRAARREAVRYAAGFVLVFIAVVFAGALLAWLIKKLVEAVGLRPVDRVLGAVFGLVRGAVLLLALAVVVNMSPAAERQRGGRNRKGADVVDGGAQGTEAGVARAVRAVPSGLGPVPAERSTCVESSALSATPQSTS